MSDYSDALATCPECECRYVVKPPFNSAHRCQKCRWRNGMSEDRGIESIPLSR